MRTKTIARWRRAALAGALAVSLGAPAQDKPQPPPAETQQTPPGETQPTPASPQTPTEIQPVPGSPSEYTVQKGDTLWDLSQKFLANPWYWPKIWSLNPAIENPHWIYPGNRLKIVPGEGGAQAPAEVQQNAPAEAAPAPDTGVAVGSGNAPDLEVVKRDGREMTAASNSVSVTGKLAFTPPPVVTVRSAGLATPEEVASAGHLDASFEERQMLSTYDTAYVRFPTGITVKPGDKLVIFRPDGDVTQPVTHRKLAVRTKTTGIAKVLSIQGPIVTVQVERTYEEIERGDLLRPWQQQMLRVAPRPDAADVKGVVVGAVQRDLSTLGESDTVFIDKGSADGVQEGNTFAVVRHGDGLNERAVTESMTGGSEGRAAAKVKTPDENVGLLLVVETKEHLSTAVVVKSVRELIPGDEVEMHAQGAGGP